MRKPKVVTYEQAAKRLDRTEAKARIQTSDGITSNEDDDERRQRDVNLCRLV
jgi:hypothetical protein